MDNAESEFRRYSINAVRTSDFNFSRRDAWKLLGGGLVVTLTAGPGAAFTPDAGTSPAGGSNQPPLSTRLHINPKGNITLLTGKVECGQGIRTTLTQVAAEELKVPASHVRLLMGDTALVPDDGGTWGSLTTPQTVPVIRQACAALRELLIRTASDQWSAPARTLQVADGRIVNANGKTFSYGDLAKSAGLERPSNIEAPVTNPADWIICGTPMRAVNGLGIVTGAHRYSSDLLKPGMLHGKIVRPPNQHGKLVSFDQGAVAERPGVTVVHDGDLLGVIAESEDTARSAAESIHAIWTAAPLGNPDTLFARLKSTSKPPETKEFGRYPSLLQKGSLEEGMKAADHRLDATYRLPYIAHVPLEARAAVAEWKDGALTVHCGTQAPFLVRDEIAKAFNVPREKVRIIVSDTGSGYGAKHNSECELEAARLARHSDRAVRLAWSREEEFTRAYCRPAGLMEVRSGVRNDGKITAWEFHNYNAGAASLTPPYVIPNHYIAYHAADSPLRQGSYRSLAAVANNFARETHIDELANQVHLDQVEFRLRNIQDGRLRTVIERAAGRFGWGRTKSGNGTGYGMSCNLEKGGHLALFVELESDGKQIHLRRMVAAFDAGAIINPDILRNQVEGALVQGIGGAVFEQLRFDNNRILNSKLSEYRLPRFTDTPEIEVILIDPRDVPSAGAGESPITVVAPAIAAALYAATGKRIRSLPMLTALHET